MDGFGSIKWPDGRIHTGYYKMDKKQGNGVYIWPDGKIYVGNWQEGK